MELPVFCTHERKLYGSSVKSKLSKVDFFDSLSKHLVFFNTKRIFLRELRLIARLLGCVQNDMYVCVSLVKGEVLMIAWGEPVSDWVTEPQ